MENQTREVERIVQDLACSGSKLETLSARMEHAAEVLLNGSFDETAELFSDMEVDLKQFLALLGSASSYLGDKRLVVELFQQQIDQQLHQINQVRKERDLSTLAELLQFELIPLFAGWNGMCRILMKNVERSEKTA